MNVNQRKQEWQVKALELGKISWIAYMYVNTTKIEGQMKVKKVGKIG